MRRNRSPATLEAPALIGLMHLQSFGGAWDATGSVLARALVAARTAGDLWAEAYALDFEALSEMDRGNPGRCLDLAREARSVALRSTSPLAWQPLALATRMIGYDALQAGRLDEAGRGFEEVIAVVRKHGDIWSLGILLTDLAGLRVLEGRHDDARACTQEAMSLVQSIRDRRGLGWCLQAIAMLEAAAGRARRAAWPTAPARRCSRASARRPDHRDAGAGALSARLRLALGRRHSGSPQTKGAPTSKWRS